MSRILVIDDDRTVQILLTRTLSNNGYDVSIAKDGIEGLELAEKIKPALIVCDWLMPGLSGLEVCRAVKQNPKLATTFFVLITSRVSVEDRVQGLDAGADDFICKPIDLQELKARVRAGLRLHQLSQDLQTQKQLLENELSEAAEYVSSLLPESLTTDKISIDFRFIPSRQLGGDIFDYFFLDKNHLVFYLLDVSGHGLKSALSSISIFNLLRSRSSGSINYYQPKEVLSYLNQNFQMSVKNDQYFTIWYGVLNLDTNQLDYSSAGHPPLILVRNSADGEKNQLLKTQGLPVGMFTEAEYNQDSLVLPSSSNLYIFSDGIYEVHNPKGEMLGLDKFGEILRANSHDLTQVLSSVTNYSSNTLFSDDLSIMKVSIT